MKPTKNRVFCPDCGRTKMLFTDKSKADNFLKFNAAEIEEENDKAPVRSYYCNVCVGWHLTSKPCAENYAFDSRYDKMVAMMQRDKERRQQTAKLREKINLVSEGLYHAENQLAEGKTVKCINSVLQWIKNMNDNDIKKPSLHRNADLLLAKAACKLALHVREILEQDKAKEAARLMEKIATCIEQIKDNKELRDYVVTLNEMMAKAQEKIGRCKRCEDMKRKLNEIRKGIKKMMTQQSFVDSLEILSKISEFTERLVGIDREYVPQEAFRDVVCNLYNIREKITADLETVNAM